MEQQLVSFGNYLLARVDQRSEAVRDCVTDADLRNWEVEVGIPAQWGNLPELGRGQLVTLCGGANGEIKGCKVIAFHSYGERHAYDLAVTLMLPMDGGDAVPFPTRFRGIDAGLLRAEEPAWIAWTGDNDYEIAEFTGQVVSNEPDVLLIGNHPDGFTVRARVGDRIYINDEGQVEILK